MEKITPAEAACLFADADAPTGIPAHICCLLNIPLPDLQRLSVYEVQSMLVEAIEAATVYESRRPTLSVIDGGCP
jgi:hypothetical protein